MAVVERSVGMKNPGRCRVVSISVECVDRRTVGTKIPGRYREVSINEGSTVFI